MTGRKLDNIEVLKPSDLIRNLSVEAIQYFLDLGLEKSGQKQTILHS